MDNVHLFKALGYIETNPIRARICRKPWLYPYSSAAAHVENIDPVGLLDMKWWRPRSKQLDWQQILQQKTDKNEIERIRICTSRSRPLASDSFISKIEKIAGRRLRPLPVGRPKKKKNEKQKAKTK